MIQKIFKNFSKSMPFQLDTDIHSHLIPGIDDGVKTWDESINLILELRRLGYKKIITTPHIMSHRYRNSSKNLLDALTELQKRLKQKNIKIEIEIAAEYYLDEHFIKLLKINDILSFGSKYVLFELPYTQEPLLLYKAIDLIKERGYTPVLAHPERYLYFSDNLEKYERLKSLGVLFQINMNSLNGYYSSKVKKIVKELIKRGFVDFVGSDLHHRRHMKNLKVVQQESLYNSIFKKNTILNNTL